MATKTNGRIVRESPEMKLAPLGNEIQEFGMLRMAPIALEASARGESTRLLN